MFKRLLQVRGWVCCVYWGAYLHTRSVSLSHTHTHNLLASASASAYTCLCTHTLYITHTRPCLYLYPPPPPILRQGLEGCEPVVLIVDDSSAVWPNDRRNLFIVERYIYFPSSRKRLGMQGRSLMEVDRWG